MRIGAHAEADDFRKDCRAGGEGPVERFEDLHARSFAKDHRRCASLKRDGRYRSSATALHLFTVLLF